MTRSFMRAVRSAFSIRTHPQKPPTPISEAEGREADREVVSGHSTGNVQLQQGLYSTREDIDRERDEVLKHEI